MNPEPHPSGPAEGEPPEGASPFDEETELQRLIARLPKKAQEWSAWLRRPSSKWFRLPAGVLLILGGLLGFLPVLGLWMLPLGLALLAEDIPAALRLRRKLLSAYAKYRAGRNSGG